MTESFIGFSLEKTAISMRGLHDPDDSHKYWWDKTPQERLAALEYLRYHAYGYDPTTDNVPRVLRVVERGKR